MKSLQQTLVELQNIVLETKRYFQMKRTIDWNLVDDKNKLNIQQKKVEELIKSSEKTIPSLRKED